jgi:hypothetical protein
MTMEHPSTRRMEMALPLLGELGADTVAKSFYKIQSGDTTGLGDLLATVVQASTPRTVRRLSAVLTATEVELVLAEGDPAALAKLEERAAEVPYKEAFTRILDFFGQLLGSLGVTLAFSDPAKQPPEKAQGPKGKRSAASRSADS